MQSEDIEALKSKHICYACIGEQYLSDEVSAKGKQAKCSYCEKTRRTFSLDMVADRVATAFEQHYYRTSDQPNDYEHMLQRDKELSYEWSRHGDDVVYAIQSAAEISSDAAGDIQSILEEEHSDFDSAAMGEETEFAGDSYYQEKKISEGAWREEWRRFENSLKTEARFFSRTAAAHLTAIFDGVDELRTGQGQPLVVDAGPETGFHALFRARVFQSDDKLELAMSRPDQQLGSPPALLAAAGRMNARGISVFYGANDPKAAIAEVRPPVGSKVAVAQFKIIRKLRLLDLTALKNVQIRGSIFDFDFARRLERAQFLKSLSGRITQPVMPDDEPFEYLATQAVADFLATECSVPIDGIIFPSVQVAGDLLNVVLFHKAARVEAMEIPNGTEIRASTGHSSNEGWEDDYSVIEEVPPALKVDKKQKDTPAWPDFAAMPALAGRDIGSDQREPALRVMPDSVWVHHVEGVVFKTDEYQIRRLRWEKDDRSPF
ncbi:RES domain-containing protein [Bradyrhizobium diazoefficiens]|uniref:RES domain-containing protein n=1 Tax=Bradyrhizobium diazoefficiens TaxID=1355477 RepID=UPI00190CB901|nr:RES domain-containing protein [Bradyrhizobium diazoefficiens]QQO14021.1 RES domain-containing protein [Bradyrhizobium diazoefficiens]